VSLKVKIILKQKLLFFVDLSRFAFGDSLPFFSLVGCSLASGAGVLTKDDELEGVCWEIREAVSSYQSKLENKILDRKIGDDLRLSDLEIGAPIAKGCNAVVYAAAFKKQEVNVDEIDVTKEFSNLPKSPTLNLPRYAQNFGGSVDNLRHNSPIISFESLRNFSNNENIENIEPKTVKFNDRVETRMQSRLSSTSESSEETHETSDDDASIYHYPWALKMMFNYDIQSNAMAILRAMYKETIPARCKLEVNDTENWEKMIADQTIALPPHPNIVLMPGYFCDQIPNLQQSRVLYPSALPVRLNPSGYGRNMSLFLLMKRYDSNLREFLDGDIDTRTRIIVFAQLLEAVAHLNRSGVAHRDLKSDNILIDSSTDSLPLLVLSDFGCCLADKNNGLRLPYSSGEIDKGGNQALMAPEIIGKEPSMFSVLNYTKSDLWACGAIAYEIFGYPNPFYSDKSAPALINETYRDEDLPEMGEDVPFVIRRLIENILQRSPGRRLTCDVAANVLELYLWAPSAWIRFGRNPSNNEVSLAITIFKTSSQFLSSLPSLKFNFSFFLFLDPPMAFKPHHESLMRGQSHRQQSSLHE
jgi:PTEN induced putative kinase 1